MSNEFLLPGYFNLAEGIILILILPILINKIYSGSKSPFAYTLSGFIFAYSINGFIWAVNQILFQEQKPLYADICWYYYFFLAFESWIFSIQYLQSVVNVSTKKQFFDIDQLTNIKWLVIVGYSCVMILLFVFQIFLFPSYS